MCMEIERKHTSVFQTSERKTQPPSWHRIIAAPTPRMASQQTANSQPQSLQRTMFLQSLNRILRTRGSEATGRRRVGRNEALIKTNGSYKHPCQNLAYHLLRAIFSAMRCNNPTMRRSTTAEATGASDNHKKPMCTPSPGSKDASNRCLFLR